MTDTALLWHRADLRTVDNPALTAACEAADAVAPVFVVDPRYYGPDGLACDARLRFLHECLTDLRAQYRDLGSDLALLVGDPRERLRACLDGPADALYYNRHPTARYGERVADATGEWPEATAVADDGLRYADQRHRDGTVAVDTREDWREQCERYFEGPLAERPDALDANPVDSETTVDAVESRWEVDPAKRDVPRGGTMAGNERLDAFCDRIAEYPANVSPPAAAETGGSRLSPYLAFGALSARQVYQRVTDCPDGRGVSMFVSRLYWNRHYHQKLADWPGWTERSVNPVFRGLFRDEHDPELVAAWKRGETGFPMVDAAMRALVETGFINFRMRAMVAAFFVYVLREWWKRGADFMYAHLIDADAAINYTQWQSQANLTGVHPVRVYDPAKQVREYDPDGEFVREYVPELAPLPDAHLPRPEKAPIAVQDDCGVRIGEDYPRPIVDFEARADAARTTYARLDDRAKEALTERVRRRGSFSNRERSRDRSEGSVQGQTSLDDF